MIKVIKKEDVLKRLDDPDIDYIERHIKSLRAFIEKRPERRDVIIEKLQIDACANDKNSPINSGLNYIKS